MADVQVEGVERMSGGAVRVSVRPQPPREARTTQERLAARAPGLSRRVLSAIERLPVRSRLRRWVTVRACWMGWEAVGRGDFELLLRLYHPHAVYATEMPPELRLPDSPRGGSFEGRAAIREYMENFNASWSMVHFELHEVILLDSGGKTLTLTLGRIHTRGRTSGIEVDIPLGILVETEHGLIVHQEDYWELEDALRAAGLDPADHPGVST
jgi:ketosteroid isomerase-like protein